MATKKRGKTPVYKDKDGTRLQILGDGYDVWRICWVDCCGMEGLEVGQEDLEDQEDPELATCSHIMMQFALEHPDEVYRTRTDGWRFETEKLAREAWRRLNIALCNLERELPDWAVTALAAGWQPPKGWKP